MERTVRVDGRCSRAQHTGIRSSGHNTSRGPSPGRCSLRRRRRSPAEDNAVVVALGTVDDDDVVAAARR